MSGIWGSEVVVMVWWSEKERVGYGREMDVRAERRAGRLLIVRRWWGIRSSAWEEATEDRSERGTSFSEVAEASVSDGRGEILWSDVESGNGLLELSLGMDFWVGGCGNGSSVAIGLSNSLSESSILEVSSW